MSKKAKKGYDVLGLIGPMDGFHKDSAKYVGQRIEIKELKKNRWDDGWFHGRISFPDLGIKLSFYQYRPRRVLVK